VSGIHHGLYQRTPYRAATAAGRTKYAKPVCYSPFLKYVFIHIPKCAGSSIHRALGGLHAQSSFQAEKPKYHKHAKAAKVREVLGPAWNESFKFAFIRNPWDLMVSSYHWWLTYAEIFPALHEDIARIREMGSFSVFIRSEFGRSMLNEHRGGDLTEWISDGDAIIVDFVGRYENLKEDWSKVCRALQVPVLPLGRENQVVRQDYRVFYDDESRELVANRFARTIELFDYRFDC
jgi:Sulfotransferase family